MNTENVCYERGTTCAHWNVDYLFENISPEDHKNVVDYKL